MNILFRVDSSSEIGLGHLMRCLVLAGQYERDNIVFAVKNLDGNANQKIINKGFKLIVLNGDSVDELVQKINNFKVDMVVFDHYGIDDRFEKSVKDATDVQVLSFDDTYDRHYCDILLNHNIYADVEKYKYLVPDFCEIRCGEKYTLIRDEFKKEKIKKRPIDKERPVVFVSLGGSDAGNIGLTVLEVLIGLNNITINLATTSSNKNIKKLQSFAGRHRNVNICIDCNIAELMNNSDCAVITPSVILYEAMFLQLPFVSIRMADNQEMIHQYLCENNYSTLGRSELDRLQEVIQKYI